jgi:hypothetical protein
MKLIGLKSVRAGLIVAAAALTVGPLMVSGGVGDSEVIKLDNDRRERDAHRRK